MVHADIIGHAHLQEQEKSPYAWPGNTCQCCHERYRGDLIVPDDVWEKIKPKGKPEGAGLLCPNCIMRRMVLGGHCSAARAELIPKGFDHTECCDGTDAY